MESPKYQSLKVIGPISIEPVPANVKVPSVAYRHLVMGPTGAGKSSLIEALAGSSQNLEISKDQLAGCTQRVTAYKIVNVERFGRPVYLIDTPGFSDAKISEQEIMEMVRNWQKENELSYFYGIFFLIPITEPRLPGSKRRTIAMLNEFLKPTRFMSATLFVTTMWNTLYSDRTRQRAETNYAQLKDEILKDLLNNGANIVRFMNTRDSVLEILETSYMTLSSDFNTAASPASVHLYRDLHDRIEGALQQKKIIESEMADPEVKSNVLLESILQDNHRENEETLTKFVGQLFAFGQVPAGFEDAHQHLQRKIEAMQRSNLVVDDAAQAVLPEDVSSTALPDFTEETHIDTATHTFTTISTKPRPTSIDIVGIDPTRMLILKGLLRRLIQAAKTRGKKWFRKGKE